ncbi:MAG: matrixin family metalloprotease [Bacteriovorax sp.]|nr:matrixin family metalloprotease [Bacteriovorax sp.]
MKVLYSIALFTLFLTSCKQQVSGNQSTSLTPNFQAGSCNIGKWSSGNLPLNLKVSPEIAADFSGPDVVGSSTNPIEQMAKVWNDAVSPSTTLFKLPLTTASGSGSATLSGFRDNELGIYKSHTWFTNVSSSALAITQFYGIVRSDASLGTYIDLTHADIILNYNNFGSDFSYTGTSFLDYDVPTILLHEMGHFLGLCHESNYNSIMAPYYYSTQRTLKTFDTNKIKALYIDNQNYGVSAFTAPTNALSAPVGSEVKGVVELNANGICKHYINGKLVYQHIQQ